MKFSKESGNQEQIVGMSIPDDEVSSWIQTLLESGFSQGEIDVIMSNNNEEYRKAKLGDQVYNKLQSDIKYIEKKRGRRLTDGEKMLLEAIVKDKFDTDANKDSK